MSGSSHWFISVGHFQIIQSGKWYDMISENYPYNANRSRYPLILAYRRYPKLKS